MITTPAKPPVHGFMRHNRRDETESSLDPTKPVSCGETLETSLPPHQLNPGEILGERFIVIQFLARGGFGEVYEAADRHLQGKHLALKTLRPEIASDPILRLRFEREVLMAREITHPNVCPTYDLFQVSGPRGPLTFLTMKLLRGAVTGRAVEPHSST